MNKIIQIVLFCAVGAIAAARPNVVVIYVDDLDNDELGVLGNQELLTPNMDQLAHEGMIFRQGYVTSTIYTPSRFGVLTGDYASRSVALQTEPASSWRNRCYPPGGPGNIHFNAILAPGQKTIGNYLQAALKGRDEPVRDQLLLEVGYGRALVTEEWKYIALRFPDFELPIIEEQGGLKNVNYNADSASANFRIDGVKYYPNHYYDFDQLYDRNRDPNEQKNLYDNPEYASKVKEMQKRLRAELESLPRTFGELKNED